MHFVAMQSVNWRNNQHIFIQPKVLVVNDLMRNCTIYAILSFANFKTLKNTAYLIDASVRFIVLRQLISTQYKPQYI